MFILDFFNGYGIGLIGEHKVNNQRNITVGNSIESRHIHVKIKIRMFIYGINMILCKRGLKPIQKLTYIRPGFDFR